MSTSPIAQSTGQSSRNPNPSPIRETVPRSSSSSSRTSAIILGSPLTSPVKVSKLVDILASGQRPPNSRLRQTMQSIAVEEDQGDSASTTVTTGEETEVVRELVRSQDDVEMNGDEEPLEGDDEFEDAEEGEVEGEEGEGDVEGEGEGEGSGSEEDEDEDEDEEDDEEDDEDSGEESEDLSGSPEIVAIDGPNGPPRLSLPPNIKAEPGTPGTSTVPADAALPANGTPALEGEDGETNVLIPKKKKRARPRSPSEDEDLPPPPPPMKTIRLEKSMLAEGETLEWNVLDEARDKGMVAEIWGVAEDVAEPIKDGMEEGMEVDPSIPIEGEIAATNGHTLEVSQPIAGPSSGPLYGLGLGDEDPEEIARRLEEKYGDDNKSKKAKKRKQVDYDLEDPFIDDSEILIDAPTHFARPKKEGFFVHSGSLELLEQSPVKAKPRTTKTKPRSSIPAPPPKEPRKSLSAALRSRKRRGQAFRGSQMEPISIDDSDGERNSAGSSRDRQANGSLSPPPPELDQDAVAVVDIPPVAIDRILYKNASRDEKYLPPWPTFPPEVRRRLLVLRGESEKHDWGPNRNRFPDPIKPYLQAAGEAAYEHDIFGLSDRDWVDRSFWHAVTSALPYNEFTLRKLCTKLCYSGYWKWLHDSEDEGIRQFTEMVKKDEEEVISKYDELHKKWEEEVKDWDEKHPSAQTNGPGPSNLTTSQPMAIDALLDGNNGTPNPNSTPKPDDNRPAEPAKRFPWTSDMREVFVQLIENMYNMVDLTVKASPQEWNIPGAKQGKEWSEIAVKQKLYKRLVEAFPEGYMNTGIISREMSRINKVKKAKQADTIEET
ncbi:uncharacterized protein IL334_006829 [Kwoniella shivajii]|uniref:Uncharacterized protein n=1 Tax=Kwoniella shivajii TaxID=564305 RepID=A0ABZ1D7P9_9TREE|nr:hypothetical protein IL334_006829 [Kwoniella shivajii]